eukprot:621441-Pleurochrysis_carterae.AAC.1
MHTRISSAVHALMRIRTRSCAYARARLSSHADVHADADPARVRTQARSCRARRWCECAPADTLLARRGATECVDVTASVAPEDVALASPASLTARACFIVSSAVRSSVGKKWHRSLVCACASATPNAPTNTRSTLACRAWPQCPR